MRQVIASVAIGFVIGAWGRGLSAGVQKRHRRLCPLPLNLRYPPLIA